LERPWTSNNWKKCSREPPLTAEKSPEKTSITSWPRKPSDLIDPYYYKQYLITHPSGAWASACPPFRRIRYKSWWKFVSEVSGRWLSGWSWSMLKLRQNGRA
jgi:hypothetical protein